MWVATMTSKGQVTVPKEVRDRLGLREQDQILFTVVDGKATLTPLPRPTAAALAGCLASDKPYPGADAIREQVQRAIAEEALGAEDTE
ncbi:MAG: AbrB/MazE/SpoVT family DNA-binding domain-containing protein [Anaerolineae bacterium]